MKKLKQPRYPTPRMWKYIEKCDFITATNLVKLVPLPDSIDGSQFWGDLSEDSPFTWGGNNRSLVAARDFADHCERTLDYYNARPGTRNPRGMISWVKKIRALGDLYIDLEN